MSQDPVSGRQVEDGQHRHGGDLARRRRGRGARPRGPDPGRGPGRARRGGPGGRPGDHAGRPEDREGPRDLLDARRRRRGWPRAPRSRSWSPPAWSRCPTSPARPTSRRATSCSPSGSAPGPSRRRTPTAAPDTVLSQDPQPGSVPQGTEVVLTVATAPPPPTTTEPPPTTTEPPPTTTEPPPTTPVAGELRRGRPPAAPCRRCAPPRRRRRTPRASWRAAGARPG